MCYIIFFSLLLGTFEMCSHSFHVAHDNDKTMKLEDLIQVIVSAVLSLRFPISQLDAFFAGFSGGTKCFHFSLRNYCNNIWSKNSLGALIYVDELIYNFALLFFYLL